MPILTVSIELIRGEVIFAPPLDRSSISISLQETVEMWITSFTDRGSLVQSLLNNVRVNSVKKYIQFSHCSAGINPVVL